MVSLIERRQSIHRQLRENENQIVSLENQLYAAQRLATIGTMAYQTAHEFNNILVPIINYAELALKHQDDAALMHKALEKIITHGNKAAMIIQSMLGMVRGDCDDRQAVNVSGVVEECFQIMARDLSKDKINVKTTIPQDLCISVVPGQFQQVLLNLLINARQAMLQRGGILTIESQPCSDGNVRIIVSDTGSGIEPDHISKIFEPFFSTKTHAEKPEQMGTGLGLSVCQDIIEAHKGSISVTSEVGRGTTFTILLPGSYTHCV